MQYCIVITPEEQSLQPVCLVTETAYCVHGRRRDYF